MPRYDQPCARAAAASSAAEKAGAEQKLPLQAKAAAKPDPEQYLAEAEDAMAAAMEMAVLTTLEATLQ